MPNNCLSVLFKRIIQVENKNVGLKVGGTNIPLSPQSKKWGGGGGTCPLPPPPLPTPVIYIYLISKIQRTTEHHRTSDLSEMQ